MMDRIEQIDIIHEIIMLKKQQQKTKEKKVPKNKYLGVDE